MEIARISLTLSVQGQDHGNDSEIVFPFNTIKTVKSYTSALTQGIKL